MYNGKLLTRTNYPQVRISKYRLDTQKNERTDNQTKNMQKERWTDREEERQLLNVTSYKL